MKSKDTTRLHQEESQKDEWTQRVNYGNIESNKLFLDRTGILDKKKRILEIGSGNGSMLNELLKQGYDIRGCDVNAHAMTTAKEVFGELPYTLLQNDELPFDDNSFDAVMSFDVFEHIPDTDKHLSEVTRVLKPNGLYVLQTPNKWTNSVFETIRWRSFTSWKEGHCSLHSYSELTKRFDNNGYKVEFFRIPVVNKFFKRKIKRFLGTLGLVAIRILNPDKLPMKLSTNFYVKAKKIE